MYKLFFTIASGVLPFTSRVFASSSSGPTSGGPVGGGSNTEITIPNPLGSESFLDIAQRIIDALFRISIPIAAIMVLVGGFQIMTAGGDPKKVTNGRNTLIYAAIGFAVVLLASSVAAVVQSVLKP
ncbi:MAG: pilin [Patescibacteria group bacterium]